MISKEDVKRVAKLARIGITKKEEEKFAKDLSSILDYIEKLKEVDVSKVKPTAHSIEMENVMRDDKENPKGARQGGGVAGRDARASREAGAPVLGLESETQNPKLLDLAPETKEGYLKTKAIL